MPSGTGGKRVAAGKRLPGSGEIALQQEESVLEGEKMVPEQAKIILQQEESVLQQEKVILQHCNAVSAF